MADPLQDLPRHGEEALGPCALCDRVILATGSPIFSRLTVRQCGVDAQTVRSHVGLAMQLGGGAGGLALASVMGPGVKPVVEVASGDVNVCGSCLQEHPVLLVLCGVACEDKALGEDA